MKAGLNCLLEITAPTDFLWFVGSVAGLVLAYLTYASFKKWIFKSLSPGKEKLLIILSLIAGFLLALRLFMLLLYYSEEKMICC